MAGVKGSERLRIDNAVVDFLYEHKGKENRVKGADIARVIREVSPYNHKYASVADFVGRIMIERRLPICRTLGQDGGYYWAKTKDEFLESIKGLEARIATMQETVEHLKSFVF